MTQALKEQPREEQQQQDMATGPVSRPGGGEEAGVDRARSVRRQRRLREPRGQLNVRLSVLAADMVSDHNERVELGGASV